MFSLRAVLVVLVPVLPLAALAVIAATSAFRRAPRWRWAAIAALSASCAAACGLLAITAAGDGDRSSITVELYHWMNDIGDITADVPIGLHVDRLSALMLVLVTLCSTLAAAATTLADTAGLPGRAVGEVGDAAGLHSRAIDDRGATAGSPSREAAALLWTVFAATAFLLSANLVQMFCFWQLATLGVCWLSIAAADSSRTGAAIARKFFLVSALADIPFLIAVLAVWFNVGSFDVSALLSDENAIVTFAGENPATMTMLCLGFLAAAAIRCAQFPFFGWLDDAIRAPGRVNCVIQSAISMPMAVYLLFRLHPLFLASPDARVITAALGGLTAVLAAWAAASERSVPGVLSFSTAACMGVILVGFASGQWTGFAAAALFLIVHSLAKTALWLNGNQSQGPQHAAFTSGAVPRWLLLLCTVVLTSGPWGQNAVMSAASDAASALPRPAGTSADATITESGDVAPAENDRTPSPPPGAGRTIVFEIANAEVPVSAALIAFALFGIFLSEPQPDAAPGDQRCGPCAWLAAIIAAAVAPAIAGAFPWFPRFLQPVWQGPVQTVEVPLFSPDVGICLLAMLSGIFAAWMSSMRRTNRDKRANVLVRIGRRRFHAAAMVDLCLALPVRAASHVCRIGDRLLFDALLVALPARVPAAAAAITRPMRNGLVQFYCLSIVVAVAVLLATLLCLLR